MKRLGPLLLILGAACEDTPGQFAEVPLADAGPDQTVVVGETVRLDGGGSSAPSGAELRFLWTQTMGPEVALEGAATPEPTFEAVQAGVLGFELLVRTGQGATSTDDVVITIDSAAAPVADAGEDQFVRPGARFMLDGGGSEDPDGQIVGWAWRQVGGPMVGLTDADQPMAEAVAPPDAALLVFELTVEDDDSRRASDQVRVTVSENLPPVADAGGDRFFTEDVVNLDGSASFDPDGQIVAYAWRAIDGPLLAILDANQAQARFEDPGRTLTIELTVTDDAGATATDQIRLVPAGTDPALDVNFPPPANDFEGRVESVFVSGRATDPDGAAIERVTVAGVEAEIDGSLWSARIPIDFGTTEVEVIATDEAMETSQQMLRVQNQPIYTEPLDLAVSPDEQRALVLDDESGLIEVDLVTEERDLIFGPSDPTFSEPNGLAVDWTNEVAYITDRGRQAVGAVDLRTRQTVLISSADVGAGPPPLTTISSPFWDESAGRLLVVGAFPQAVLQVDTLSGDRTVLSGNDLVGDGPNIGGTSLDMALDPAGNRVFLSSFQILYEIDLSTGDRAQLLFNSPSNRRYHSCVWDAGAGRLLLANEGLEAYDPATQSFESLSFFPPDFVTGLHLRADGSGVVSAAEDQLMEAELGDRPTVNQVLVPQVEVGRGPSFDGGVQAVFLNGERKLFFVEPQTFQIFEVDVETGDRALFDPSSNVEFISRAGGQLIGVGGRGASGFYALDTDDGQATQLQMAQPDQLNNAGSIVMKNDASAALLGPFVRRFDLGTGETIEVSGPNVGRGPAFGSGFPSGAMTWADEATEEALLVVDGEAILEIDVASGDRRIVTGRGIGDGPRISGASGLVVDPDDPRTLFVSDAFRGVFRIDLPTGERRVLSGPPRSSVVQLDPERRRLYLIRGSINEVSGVITVDLASGQWVVSSK